MEIHTKSVYAVIVSWNGIAWIRQTLESLKRSTFPVRIVTVDNASTDETVKTIHDFFTDVDVLSMPANLGFAKANNHGISYALSQGADYVLLLNQDAKVDPSMVGLLVYLLEKYPDFGVMSPLHLDYQGDEIDPVFFQHMRDNMCMVTDTFFSNLQELYEIPYINAAAWLVTRRVFQEVGGFDPLFFMYGEDQDYCQRMRFHGFKIGLAPKAIAYHWHGGGINRPLTFSERYVRYYAEMLHRLKRPERFFIKSALGLLPTWTRRLVIMLMDLDLRGIHAIIFSFFKVIFNFPRIWRHYECCKHLGDSWL